MADFDESKVKRDKDGKFAEKNAGNGQSAKELDLKYNQTAEIVPKDTLTKKEFAVWYQKIGEIKRGGQVYKNKKKEMYIPITEKSADGFMCYKIAVTAGSYQKPKLKKVYEFKTGDALSDFLGELEN